MSISKGFICTNFWSSSSLVWEKAYLCLFVYKISQVQILSLSLIINQTKLKYKNVFVNKLMNIRTVRTYVFHMLGSYVTILCNWLSFDKTYFICNWVVLGYF